MVQMARESLLKKKKKNENDATPSLSISRLDDDRVNIFNISKISKVHAFRTLMILVEGFGSCMV